MQDFPGTHAPRGLFLCLEGGEGAGKSTQARLLVARLEAQGRTVVLTREPGDTLVGARVRELLLDPATGAMADRTEALLYAADKAEHVERVVLPALARDEVVVTDRYVDSTLAYQGAGRSLDPAELAWVARWATGDLRPHLTLLLDLDPAAGMGRFEGRDRIESEGDDFHRRVRAEFLRLAATDPGHYAVVDASRSPDEVADDVWSHVAPLLVGVR